MEPVINYDIQFVCFIGIANIAKRERNRAAKQLDFLMKVQFFELLAVMLFDMDSVRKGEVPMLDMQDMSMDMEYMLSVKHAYFLKLDAYISYRHIHQRKRTIFFFVFINYFSYASLYMDIIIKIYHPFHS